MRAVGQWLVDILALVDPQVFHVTWRVPAPFLVLAQTDGMSLNERMNLLREQMERCISERQMVWGDAELARRAHLRVGELGPAYFEALARYWGRRLIGGGGSTAKVDELADEQRDALARLLTVYDLRARQLGTWPMFEQIMEGLAASLEERLATAEGSADRYLLDAVEASLLEQGWFDAPASEARFLESRLSDLSRLDRDGIAAYLGEQMLLPRRTDKVSALEPALRQRVLDLLRSRGRFLDEAGLQDFLIHRRLSDLGPERAAAACRHIVLEQWEPLRGRPIQEMDPAVRERVVAALREGGYMWDQPARQRILAARLGELEPAILDTVARLLGAEEWPAIQPAGALDGARRAVARATLEASGLFLKREQVEAFRLGDLAGLPGELKARLAERLLARLRAILSEKAGKELPRSLQPRVRRALEEAGYFLDADKVAQWEQRTLSSLDGKALTALERSVGKAIMAKVEALPFVNLDKALRDAVISYLDRENIYRKSAKRREFMQRPMLELDATLYDGIAGHLGRESLAPLRAQPINRLPADTLAALKALVQTKGELSDPARVAAFEGQPLDRLPDDARRAVLGRLERDLDALLAGQGEPAELYEGMLLDARQFLTDQGYFTQTDADERFAALRPEILDPALRDEAYRALGRRVLEPALSQRPAELSAEVGELSRAGLRERVLDALGRSGAFTDREKEGSLLRSRLHDLAPDIRDGVVAAWARALQREIGDRLVAEVDEEVRRGVRSYLDASGYFISPALMQEAEDLVLAGLRREDWQALASALGGEALERRLDASIKELPAELREGVLAYLRKGGRFLDETRRAEFRAHGLAGVPAAMREAALARAVEADRVRLSAAMLAGLSDTLRWEVERLAVDAAEPAEFKRMRAIERQALTDLEPDLYDGFLRYLGFPYTLPLRGLRLGELAGEERQILCEFLGDRVALEIQKRVMLSYVSRLWIDYLTDMEDLRQGIGLEAFGQRDPLVEYKRRAYQMFQGLTDEIRQGILSRVFALEPFELS